MPRTPAAFLSYVQLNDKHDNGRVTELRERLESEVQIQTGEPFPIFQDRNDIQWGQQWRDRIDQGIDASTFLIAIITPSYLQSPSCRSEFEAFLKREQKLRREDLILPLLYVDTPLLSDAPKQTEDSMVREISKRQWADWRDLRHEPWTSPEVGKRLAKLAIQIRNVIDRDVIRRPKSLKRSARKQARSSQIGKIIVLPDLFIKKVEPQSNEHGPSPQTEAKIITVDPVIGRANCQTISEAIRKANGGERILVRPGIYNEGLVLDKPLEIVGDGPRAEIIVESGTTHTLRATTDFGRVVNLTLRQTGNANFRCVHITQGRLQMEDCEISSHDSVCIGVQGGADPRMLRCAIHDAKRSGIHLVENAKGTFEDNDIFGHSQWGIEIWTGSDPVFRRNRIHNCGEYGLIVHSGGKGTIEENEIFSIRGSGIATTKGSDPLCRRNRIHDNHESGVLCSTDGKGTFEDNEILINDGFGIVITNRAEPVFRRNRIYANKGAGVVVTAEGKGLLEQNSIFANPIGILVRSDGVPCVRDNRIYQNANCAVFFSKGGGGVFEKNDLRGNRRVWFIERGSIDNSVRSENIEK